MGGNDPIKYIKRAIWMGSCVNSAGLISEVCFQCPSHLASSQQLIAGNLHATLLLYLLLVIDTLSQVMGSFFCHENSVTYHLRMVCVMECSLIM